MKDFTLKYSWKYLLPVFLLCWVGCTSENGETLPDETESDLPICLDVASEKMQNGRSLIENSTALQTACSTGGQAIGIWSAHEKEGKLTQHVLANATGDVALVFDTDGGSPNSWTYGELAFWRWEAKYYFNAYFPKEGGMTITSNTPTSMKGTYNTLTTQQDLMVCRASVDTGSENFRGSPIPLDMKHALSSLKFTFRLEEGARIARKIQSLSFDNTLAVSGTLEYQTGAIAISNWAELAYSSGAVYAWSNEGMSCTADNIATAYTTPEGTITTEGSFYCNNDGHLLIIPQTCSEAPSITIVTDTKRFENVSLGNTQFEPGKLYVYNIVFNDVTLDISLSIKDWNSYQSSHVIPL